MATDYPIEITDPDGSVRIAGLADFTDPDNQPAAGGTGGGPGEPYTPTAGQDLPVLVDSSGDKIIEYDDDAGILELNSPNRNQQLYVSNAGIQLPTNLDGLLGFYSATPIEQPTVSNATAVDIIAALVSLGLIIDGT